VVMPQEYPQTPLKSFKFIVEVGKDI
jgi:hypothetical protein